MTKKQIKATTKIALGALGLSAINVGAAGLPGTNLVGSLTQGFGAAFPAVGSILGAGMTISQARKLQKQHQKMMRR